MLLESMKNDDIVVMHATGRFSPKIWFRVVLVIGRRSREMKYTHRVAIDSLPSWFVVQMKHCRWATAEGSLSEEVRQSVVPPGPR